MNTGMGRRDGFKQGVPVLAGWKQDNQESITGSSLMQGFMQSFDYTLIKQLVVSGERRVGKKSSFQNLTTYY